MGSDAYTVCLQWTSKNQSGRTKASQLALENLVLKESSVLCNGSLPEGVHMCLYTHFNS